MIRLDEYRIAIFTPYYNLSPPPWKVVINSMSSFLYFCHYQKGVSPANLVLIFIHIGLRVEGDETRPLQVVLEDRV